MLIRKKLVCKDGATVSVQAGRWHYCTPRLDNSLYTHVEAGFPEGDVPKSWKHYAEDKDNLSGTVYPYIPYSLIYEFIKMHGGIESQDLPPCLSRALTLPFFYFSAPID